MADLMLLLLINLSINFWAIKGFYAEVRLSVETKGTQLDYSAGATIYMGLLAYFLVVEATIVAPNTFEYATTVVFLAIHAILFGESFISFASGLNNSEANGSICFS